MKYHNDAKYYQKNRDAYRAKFGELTITKTSERTTIESGQLVEQSRVVIQLLGRTVHERQAQTTTKRTAETAFGLNDSGRISKTYSSEFVQNFKK